MNSSTPQLRWQRDGLVMSRTAAGDGSEVVGDPCIVWDPAESAWRMFLFFEPPGHATSLSRNSHPSAPDWEPAHVLNFVNGDALTGGTHKPFVVMDPYEPNHAAFVDGKYWLLTVSHDGNAREKRVQRAWAETLAGPWTVEQGDLIPRGSGSDFDANHVDAVSGYWFPEIDSFVYYYMGYPSAVQAGQASPLGSSIGLATQRRGEARVNKQGAMLRPANEYGHWASGWVGGIQIFPGTSTRWVGVLNASPTPPDSLGRITSEEPAPSLGGFAYTNETLPISGWRLDPEPIEWIDDIPDHALNLGEGTNLWRQHILLLGDEASLYYNSGYYGQEQLYSKTIKKAAIGIK